jgi:hypothetical protein
MSIFDSLQDLSVPSKPSAVDYQQEIVYWLEQQFKPAQDDYHLSLFSTLGSIQTLMSDSLQQTGPYGPYRPSSQNDSKSCDIIEAESPCLNYEECSDSSTDDRESPFEVKQDSILADWKDLEHFAQEIKIQPDLTKSDRPKRGRPRGMKRKYNDDPQSIESTLQYMPLYTHEDKIQLRYIRFKRRLYYCAVDLADPIVSHRENIAREVRYSVDPDEYIHFQVGDNNRLRQMIYLSAKGYQQIVSRRETTLRFGKPILTDVPLAHLFLRQLQRHSAKK